MFEERKAALSQTITLFESLRESYKVTREHLYARRRGAADHVMVELDERLAANARTIESFDRAVECLRAQLASLETHAASGGLLTRPATSERPEGSHEARSA